MTFTALQQSVNAWARRNFGPHVPPYHRCLLGAMEEIGELATQLHAMTGQSDRYDRDALCDAIGDVTISLVSVCNALGVSWIDCVTTSWLAVQRRKRPQDRNGDRGSRKPG